MHTGGEVNPINNLTYSFELKIHCNKDMNQTELSVINASFNAIDNMYTVYSESKHACPAMDILPLYDFIQ